MSETHQTLCLLLIGLSLLSGGLVGHFGGFAWLIPVLLGGLFSVLSIANLVAIALRDSE